MNPLEPTTQRSNAIVLIAMVLSTLALLFSGCSKSYPDCDDDSTCRSRQEVCVDGRCRQCKVDAHCEKVDACMTCQGNECVRSPGCCKSDLDCPAGKCWKSAGDVTGRCGGVCQDDSHCPSGQRCANGGCVPADECSASRPCPSGQKCIGGRCEAACEAAPILFDYAESAVRLDMESVVRANANCIKESALNVGIEGHCDERGSDEYNLALGERRANAVSKQYKALGVPAAQMRKNLSYGEEKPVCEEENEGCWQRNRRAETVQK
jgi:peptidoglycan-associated lipoprotein